MTFAKNLLATATALTLWVTLISCDNPPNPWELRLNYAPDTYPLFYAISVFPNMSDGTFTGNTTIDIRVTAEKHFLWLSFENLRISSTSVMTSSMEYISIKRAFHYYRTDFFVIELVNTITPGDYKLWFHYRGKIVNGRTYNDINFFYAYDDPPHGESVISYSTYCFPCFCREDFKTVFQIQIVQPSSYYRVLSNTNPQNVTQDLPSTGMATVTFEKTPIMRPSSVFFMVTSLDRLPTVYSQDKIAITLYGRTKILTNLQRGLNAALNAVNYYTTYLNYSLPLRKIDLVAFPPGRDVSYVYAFNLLGISVIYEGTVMYEEGVTSASSDIDGATTVAHEISHNWFAELDGITALSEFFLYESLASYFEAKATQILYPQWDLTSIELVINNYNSMTDELYVEKPLALTAPTNDRDKISYLSLYSKGPALLRMMDCFMGEDNTRLGYIDYVKTFAFKTALVTDLWRMMQTYAPKGVNITRVMTSWTKQIAYPLVTVDHIGDTLVLNQTRFLVDKNATYNRSDSPFGFVWEIPVTLMGSNNFKTENTLWLGSDNPNLTVSLPDGVRWVKVNLQQCGYYIVNYSLRDWNLLAMLLRQDINEYFSSKLSPHLDDSIWIISPLTPPDFRSNQSILITDACWLGIPSCLEMAKRIFDNWLLHCDRKPPLDVRETVYNTGMSLSGLYEWKILRQRYLNETDQEEKDRLQSALCRTKDSWIILHLLDTVQEEDLVDFIKKCLYYLPTVPTIWMYFRENWTYLAANFHDDLVEILNSIVYSFVNDIQLKEVEDFFKNVPEKDISTENRQVILNMIENNIALQTKYAGPLIKWFHEALQ